jgi:peptide/nickel transport system permease protein
LRRYLTRRLLTLIPVVALVTFAVFLMLHMLPVDPVRMMIENEAGGSLQPVVSEQVSRQQYDEMKRQLGLDKPLLVQYGLFLYKASTGDLGRSFATRRSVVEMIAANAPSTVQLAVTGLGMAVVLGLVLGVVAALKRNTVIDAAVMGMAVTGLSLPSFWLGMMLILLISFQLGLLPVVSAAGWRGLILPALTLGLRGAAVLARLTRSSLIEILQQEYVRTAWAKGLPTRLVVFKHALRNALIPVVTVVGLQFGALLSGAVIVESVFGRPGLGSMAIQAILSKDFPVVQGAVLVLSLSYLLVNLLVDLTYPLIDPRIRLGG